MSYVDAGPAVSTLVVRNLRFLDLDLHEDWPGIDTETFRPPSNTRLQQKGRVRSAEWVLYKLYELWQPAEAESVSATLK